MEQYSGATTTANSASEGRLKVDAGKKRSILKKSIKKIGSLAKSGVEKFKKLVDSVGSGIKKVTPYIPEGAMYKWDEKTNSYVGNNKYRRLVEDIEKSNKAKKNK